MSEVQGRYWIADKTELILGDVYLQHVLYYTGNQTNHVISTENIIHGLMNPTPMYPMRERTHNMSLHLHHNPEIVLQYHHIHIDLILYELELSDTPFMKSTIIKSELEISPQGKNSGMNLMDNDDFNIPYVVEFVPNFLAGHQFPDKTKKISLIVRFYGEDSVMASGSLEEIKLLRYNNGR